MHEVTMNLNYHIIHVDTITEYACHRHADCYINNQVKLNVIILVYSYKIYCLHFATAEPVFAGPCSGL